MNKNDGGPAFPFEPLNSAGMPTHAMEPGMSLRAYFAAHAPDSLIAHALSEADDPRANRTQVAVDEAVDYADRMIAKLTKEPKA